MSDADTLTLALIFGVPLLLLLAVLVFALWQAWRSTGYLNLGRGTMVFPPLDAKAQAEVRAWNAAVDAKKARKRAKRG